MNVQYFTQLASQVAQLAAKEEVLAHRATNPNDLYSPHGVSILKQQLKTTRQQLVVAKQNLLVML